MSTKNVVFLAFKELAQEETRSKLATQAKLRQESDEKEMLKEKLEEEEDSKHQLEKQVQDLQQRVCFQFLLPCPHSAVV